MFRKPVCRLSRVAQLTRTIRHVFTYAINAVSCRLAAGRREQASAAEAVELQAYPEAAARP